MAESYTDEEFEREMESDHPLLNATARRFKRERDDARRVAKVLAKFLHDDMGFRDNAACDEDPCPEIQTALAYPDKAE